MKLARLPLLALLLFQLAACASATPMNTSQFLGFCYQVGGRMPSCDNIGMCNEYISVFETKHRSANDCLRACQEVTAKLKKNVHGLDNCSDYIPSLANDICQRGCRKNYPE